MEVQATCRMSCGMCHAHVSCIMYHVSRIMYHVSCIMSCAMCHVSCTISCSDSYFVNMLYGQPHLVDDAWTYRTHAIAFPCPESDDSSAPHPHTYQCPFTLFARIATTTPSSTYSHAGCCIRDDASYAKHACDAYETPYASLPSECQLWRRTCPQTSCAAGQVCWTWYVCHVRCMCVSCVLPVRAIRVTFVSCICYVRACGLVWHHMRRCCQVMHPSVTLHASCSSRSKPAL